MRILVTGAASPLGRAVVSLLVQKGHRVVGLARRVDGIKALQALGAKAIRGDVRRPPHVMQASIDCELVLHLAGFFDFWEPADGTYAAVNVEATRTVVHAALRAGARRLVVCSSAATLGSRQAQRGAEREAPRSALERSRIEAEWVALKGRSRGLQVVLVNAGLVVAPGDPGWVGSLLRRAVAGERPLAGNAPLSWVWVEDAARAVVKAATVGDDGARYVLSGDSVSSHKMLSAMAMCVGAPGARVLPPQLTLAEAALRTAIARPLRRRPQLALDEARLLLTGFQADGRNAPAELGFDYTPAARYVPLVAREYAKALRRVERSA